MKNKFTVIASVFQVLAILCYIVIIKGSAGVIAGNTEPAMLLFAIFLAIIFQGLSYTIGKKDLKN
jgi:hypothetical protein